MPKPCFVCAQVKPLTDFYKHPKMTDGRLGKCKECTKADVRANYAKTRKFYSESGAARNKTSRAKASRIRNQRAMRARSPEKYAAWSAVSKEIRAGRLTRGPCLLCGTTVRVQAHHEDYAKPLEVEWLCFKCHREHRHGQVVSNPDGGSGK